MYTGYMKYSQQRERTLDFKNVKKSLNYLFFVIIGWGMLVEAKKNTRILRTCRWYMISKLLAHRLEKIISTEILQESHMFRSKLTTQGS